MIAQTTIQQVRHSASITQVVESYGLTFGRNKAACCPFHNEKTGSFRVHEAKGYFKCFGCGVGGDAIRFVQMMEKSSFPEAVEKIASLCGIAVEYDAQANTEEAKAKRASKAEYLKINSWAVGKFQQQLNEHTEAQDYLSARNWDDHTIAQWMLGYTPGGILRDFLLERGMAKAGVAIGLLRESAGITKDAFYGRIIFPIQDHQGEVVGFGARRIDGKKEMKYINSPDSILYKKEHVLYGLYAAAKGIKDAGFAILVEGYADVISMHQAGANNTIASCGTALTEAQCKLIKRHTSRVIVMRDGDDAGSAATLRDVELLLRSGINPQVVCLDKNMDPDDFAQTFITNENNELSAPKPLKEAV